MGKLIVDGKSVYEIDEECMKNRRVPTGCKIEEAIERMERRESVCRRFDVPKEG